MARFAFPIFIVFAIISIIGISQMQHESSLNTRRKSTSESRSSHSGWLHKTGRQSTRQSTRPSTRQSKRQNGNLQHNRDSRRKNYLEAFCNKDKQQESFTINLVTIGYANDAIYIILYRPSEFIVYQFEPRSITKNAFFVNLASKALPFKDKWSYSYFDKQLDIPNFEANYYSLMRSTSLSTIGRVFGTSIFFEQFMLTRYIHNDKDRPDVPKRLIFSMNQTGDASVEKLVSSVEPFPDRITLMGTLSSDEPSRIFDIYTTLGHQIVLSRIPLKIPFNSDNAQALNSFPDYMTLCIDVDKREVSIVDSKGNCGTPIKTIDMSKGFLYRGRMFLFGNSGVISFNFNEARLPLATPLIFKTYDEWIKCPKNWY